MSDYRLGTTFSDPFNSRTKAGDLVTLTDPVFIVRRGSDGAESAAGLTLTVDEGGITGLHRVEVDTSADAFYQRADSYAVRGVSGTAGDYALAGEIVSEFTIELANAGNAGLPQQFFAVSEVVNAGTITSGSFTDTQVEDGVKLVADGQPDIELVFNIGSANVPSEVSGAVSVLAGGNRSISVQVRNFTLAQWDTIQTITNSGGDNVHFLFRSLGADYVNNGECRLRFVSVNLNNNDEIGIDQAQFVALTSAGSVPTAEENAQATELLNAEKHGSGSHRGTVTLDYRITAVNSQTEFVLDRGGAVDDFYIGQLFGVRSTATGEIAAQPVIDWDAGTLTVTIEAALPFVVQVDDDGAFILGAGGGGDATEAKQDTILAELDEMQGAAFDTATDSLQAIRDRGDAAWVTGSGGGSERNVISHS